jgi:hypothetical protein
MTTADHIRTIAARLFGYQVHHRGHGFDKVHHSLSHQKRYSVGALLRPRHSHPPRAICRSHHHQEAQK